MTQKFLFLFLFVFAFLGKADAQYSKFIDAQLQLVYEMNENNVTQEKLEGLIETQNLEYEKALEVLMANKADFLNATNLLDSEMFSLNKIISINQRAGNTYAVLRDEIKLKSYMVSRNQILLIKDILLALDAPNVDAFEEKLNKAVQTNQAETQKLYEKDYAYVNDVESSSSTIIQAKKNLREFYALRDVNADTINNSYKLKNKMYRLNKYTKYHLIGAVIYVNNAPVAKDVNPILEEYGLSVVKLAVIAILILLIYFFRKLLNFALKSYILTIDSLSSYAKEIMRGLYKPLDVLVIMININMVIYVYENFSSEEGVANAFNLLYTIVLTFMAYQVLNTIATIKVMQISGENRVKSEIINVGLKILNFVVFTIGLLIVLYFAGVNLTAVLSGLGIGGLGVAFAAKDTISNFFGTLSVLFSDVFSQGDWIVVGESEGVVVEIGLRVTTIRTFDNALIAIPNGTFATVEVKNWNKRTLGRRIKMNVGVKYDSKSEDLKNAINEIRTMLDKHPGIATVNTKYEHRGLHGAKLLSKDDYEGVKKTLLVYLDEFGPSSVNILVYCFSKSVVWQEWLEAKEDVMHKIMEILEKNSLEFAFPSLSIYNEKSD